MWKDAENAWYCTKTRDIKPNCYGNSWKNNNKEGAVIIITIFFFSTTCRHFIILVLNISEHEAYSLPSE